MPEPTLVPAILAAGIPEDAFRVQPGVMPEELHSRRNEYPSYEGGLSVRAYSDQRNAFVTAELGCTTWFTTRDLSDDKYKGITAGHCEKPNPDKPKMGDIWAVMDGIFISWLTSNSTYDNDGNAVNTNSDAVRFTIPDEQARHRVYVGGSNLVHRTVKSPRFYVSGLKKDVKLCWLGTYSGNNNCGYIYIVDASPTDSRHKHYWCLNRIPADASGGGDSGGPVFGLHHEGAAKPAGITWGGTTGKSHCFHAVGYVLDDMGVEIHYNT